MGLPADGTHARTGRRRGGRGPCRESCQGFLPAQRSCHLQEPQQRRERARDTTEALHAATAKSATELSREERGGEPDSSRRERESWRVWDEKGEGEREKPLTGLSMSVVRAGLGPGVRQPRRHRGLPGVDDHASITMSQVGQAAKTSSKCTELPC